MLQTNRRVTPAVFMLHVKRLAAYFANIRLPGQGFGYGMQDIRFRKPYVVSPYSKLEAKRCPKGCRCLPALA